MIERARRLRATYAAHPAAASLSACRTTQRPAEMRSVNILIGAVLEAGFEGAEAARVYRALGDFALAWAGLDAAFLALDERPAATDRAAWTRAYLAADRAEFPHIWQVRDWNCRTSTDDDIFDDHPVAGHRRAHPAGSAPVRLRGTSRVSLRPGRRGR